MPPRTDQICPGEKLVVWLTAAGWSASTARLVRTAGLVCSLFNHNQFFCLFHLVIPPFFGYCVMPLPASGRRMYVAVYFGNYPATHEHKLMWNRERLYGMAGVYLTEPSLRHSLHKDWYYMSRVVCSSSPFSTVH